MKIDVKEALRYLGCPSDDKATAAAVEKCAEIIEKVITPYKTYRLFDIKPDAAGVKFLNSEIYFKSAELARLMKNSSRCAVIAVTLGSKADKMISLYQKTNLETAVTFDACCSAAIESVCDEFSEYIKSKENIKFLTARYSPGYGDLDISCQKTVINLLDTQRKIGLSVNPSMLLTPVKSVTAFMGITDKPYMISLGGCAACPNRDNCNFKKTCMA